MLTSIQHSAHVATSRGTIAATDPIASEGSIVKVGLAVFEQLAVWIEGPIFLAVDDTLARKRALKTFGAGMHLDPILSSRGMKLVNWGHSWVVLSLPRQAYALV